MQLRRKFLVVILGLMMIIGVAQAQVASPVTVLQTAANQMISSLAQNKGKLKQNTGIIYGIVNRVLLPYIDLNRMSMAVVGRQYWTSATPAQRSEFIKQFTHLVTSTYAAALASYDDDVVKFYPIRGDYSKSNTLTVRSMIVRRNGQKIAVDYNVVRNGDSWKVYDFSIENISMVQSYRSQFADVLSRQGMDGLLKQLKAHNQTTPQ